MTFQKLGRTKTLYVFLLPTFMLLIIFNYYPAFSALYHSLFDWNGVSDPKFIGVGNLMKMASDSIFLKSIGNMVIFTIANVLIAVTMPLVAAELIFNLRSRRMQYVYRVLFVVPMAVPGIVQFLLWNFIYAPSGVLNQFLSSVGLSSITRCWLGDSQLALGAIIFVGFPWVSAFNFLIYLAGLQNIPTDIFDCATMDGANWLRRVIAVDIPLILSQVKVIVVLSIIGSVQSFQTILVMTGGGPGWATMVPALYMYQNAFQYSRVGYGMAIGTVLFFFVLGLTYLNMKYLRSAVEYAPVR